MGNKKMAMKFMDFIWYLVFLFVSIFQIISDVGIVIGILRKLGYVSTMNLGFLKMEMLSEMTENEEEIKFESNFESDIRTNDGFDNALFVILIGIAVLMVVLYLLNLCSCCFRSTKKTTKNNDYGTLTAL